MIAAPQMVTYTGYLKLPGTERIQLDFDVRKGATQAEKDLAFFNALAQLGTVDYLAVGEKEALHE